MRVVVDTNILISAALKDKSLPVVAVRAMARHVMLKSAATERQLFEVMVRPHLARLISPASRAWLTGLMAAAELTVVSERIAACRDPTDDKFHAPPLRTRRIRR